MDGAVRNQSEAEQTEAEALHRRTVELVARPEGEGLRIAGRLVDRRGPRLREAFGGGPERVHDMRVDLTLDRDGRVSSALGAMERAPYDGQPVTRGEGCRDVLPRLADLHGLQIGADYAAQVLSRIGASRGCFHLLHLVLYAGPVALLATDRACATAAAAGSPPDAAARCHALGGLGSPPKAAHTSARPHIAARRFELAAYAAPESAIELKGRLCDAIGEDEKPVQQTTLQLTLAPPTFAIAAVRAAFPLAPVDGANARNGRESCTGVLPRLEGLRGLHPSRGFTAAALEVIGPPSGCGQLASLLLALLPVAGQLGLAIVAGSGGHHESGGRARSEPPLIDSCHMWRRGGPLARMICGDENED